jgi:hypothetical protein
VNQLFNAIALEVGFQLARPALITKPGSIRKLYICNEVKELRSNSGFTTEAQFRVITMDHVIEAVILKTQAFYRSLTAGAGFVLHYESGAKPFHCKTSYVREADCRRAAIKLNARHPGANPYVCSSVMGYVARTRGKLVRNIMSGTYVMETTGTNFANSVSSESYWCS